MNKKSVLEQALLQVQNLEEAVKANAEGILASTMKKELNDVLSESMEEEVKIAEEGDIEEAEKETINPPVQNPVEIEEKEDVQEQPIPNVEDENDMPTDKVGNDEPSIKDEPADDEIDPEDILDMTKASDDEVLKVFKAMKPEDGIIVKKDGDDLEVSVDGEEFVIKLDDDKPETPEKEPEEEPEEEPEALPAPETGEEPEAEEDSEEPEAEEDSEEPEAEEDSEEDDEEEKTPEEEVDEAARSQANDVRSGARQGKKYKAGRPDFAQLQEEIKTLKEENEKYKTNLGELKDRMDKVALFSANLAYVNNLFTENATTKAEKQAIIKRFDTVETLEESKVLHKIIKGELSNKQPISETVEEKINTTPTSSKSKEVLSENKVYENNQFSRIKELIGKMNK